MKNLLYYIDAYKKLASLFEKLDECFPDSVIVNSCKYEKYIVNIGEYISFAYFLPFESILTFEIYIATQQSLLIVDREKNCNYVISTEDHVIDFAKNKLSEIMIGA